MRSHETIPHTHTHTVTRGGECASDARVAVSRSSFLLVTPGARLRLVAVPEAVLRTARDVLDVPESARTDTAPLASLASPAIISPNSGVRVAARRALRLLLVVRRLAAPSAERVVPLVLLTKGRGTSSHFLLC